MLRFSIVRGQLLRIGAAVAIGFGLIGAAHAANDLTEAGTSVSNTFELNYSVSGTAQPLITNNSVSPPAGADVQGTPTEFTVDRKIDLIVTATALSVSAAPGATATVGFELLNEGNDTAAYSFSIDDLDNSPLSFDATGVTIRYMVDANDNGTADDGSYTTISETPIATAAGSAFYTSDVPKGVLVFVEIEGTVPTSVSDGNTEYLTLVTETRDPTAFLNEASVSPGAVTTATSGSNVLTGTAQNVLADGTGVALSETSGDGDGIYATTGTIIVQSPDLSASKTVTVIKEPGIADPFVDLTDCDTATAVAEAKAIPGACLEYVIEVENTGATVTASNLVIDDILPAEVTFVAASLATTTTNGFEDDSGVAGTGPVLSVPSNAAESDCDGSTTCVIQLSDAELAAGEIGQIVIRALVK